MIDKIKNHHDTKTYTKIFRSCGKTKLIEATSGYIVSYSDDFIILQETNDFILEGYTIIPVSQIKKLRYNKWDKYYNKIMVWEGKVDDIALRFPVDLSSWKSIFDSIKGHELNVIANCELSDDYFFTIGPIVAAKKNSVQILNFDPAGFYEDTPTTLKYKEITKVQFDDRYANVFGKYLRHRKAKTTQSNTPSE